MPRAVSATEKQASNQARERVKNQASRPKSRGETTAKAARKNEQTGTGIKKKKKKGDQLFRRARERAGKKGKKDGRELGGLESCIKVYRLREPCQRIWKEKEKSAVHIRPASWVRGVSSRQNGCLLRWTRRSIDQNADQRHPLMVNQ